MYKHHTEMTHSCFGGIGVSPTSDEVAHCDTIMQCLDCYFQIFAYLEKGNRTKSRLSCRRAVWKIHTSLGTVATALPLPFSLLCSLLGGLSFPFRSSFIVVFGLLLSLLTAGTSHPAAILFGNFGFGGSSCPFRTDRFFLLVVIGPCSFEGGEVQVWPVAWATTNRRLLSLHLSGQRLSQTCVEGLLETVFVFRVRSVFLIVFLFFR